MDTDVRLGPFFIVLGHFPRNFAVKIAFKLMKLERRKLEMAHGTAQQKIKATKSKIQAAESLKNFSEDTA